MPPKIHEPALPRPNTAPKSPHPPIPGPAEASFKATFGALLPPAQFLQTSIGNAAYYELPDSSPGKGTGGKTLDRVLFIHGVQTPALGLLPPAQALQQSFPQADFALLDLWGHGLSDTPVLAHEPGLFYGLVDAVLERLRWPRVHLVGYSLGASLTAGYVASRSERVKSYVLVAPAGLIPSASLSETDRAHLRGDSGEAAARKWVVEWLEGGDLVVPGDWKERVGTGEVVAEAVKEWQMREHAGHSASVLAIIRDACVFDNDAEFVRAVETEIPGFAVLGVWMLYAMNGSFMKLGL